MYLGLQFTIPDMVAVPPPPPPPLPRLHPQVTVPGNARSGLTDSKKTQAVENQLLGEIGGVCERKKMRQVVANRAVRIRLA